MCEECRVPPNRVLLRTAQTSRSVIRAGCSVAVLASYGIAAIPPSVPASRVFHQPHNPLTAIARESIRSRSPSQCAWTGRNTTATVGQSGIVYSRIVRPPALQPTRPYFNVYVCALVFSIRVLRSSSRYHSRYRSGNDMSSWASSSFSFSIFFHLPFLRGTLRSTPRAAVFAYALRSSRLFRRVTICRGRTPFAVNMSFARGLTVFACVALALTLPLFAHILPTEPTDLASTSSLSLSTSPPQLSSRSAEEDEGLSGPGDLTTAASPASVAQFESDVTAKDTLLGT